MVTGPYDFIHDLKSCLGSTTSKFALVYKHRIYQEATEGTAYQAHLKKAVFEKMAEVEQKSRKVGPQGST